MLHAAEAGGARQKSGRVKRTPANVRREQRNSRLREQSVDRRGSLKLHGLLAKPRANEIRNYEKQQPTTAGFIQAAVVFLLA